MPTKCANPVTPVVDVAVRRRAVLRELADVARRPVTEAEFRSRWLTAVVAALNAQGAVYYEAVGCDFTTTQRHRIEPVPAERSDVVRRRNRFFAMVAEHRQPIWQCPRGTSANSIGACRGSEFLVLTAPASTAFGARNVVELHFTMVPPSSLRALYEKLLVQARELHDEFLLRTRERALARHRETGDAVLQFAESVYSSIELRPTAYAVVNDGRVVVGCDRLSLVVRRRRKYVVAAISGQDRFDHRSPVVKAAVALATTVCAIGQPLSSGDEPSGTLPPALETELGRFLDVSQAKRVRVVPLTPRRTLPEGSNSALERSSIGALVVEYFGTNETSICSDERLDFAAGHAARAVANALTHEQIFLSSLWRVLGNARAWIARSKLRTGLIAVSVLAAFALLALLPADWTLRAEAIFQPVVRRDVFAPIDGVVERLHVRHGQRVAKGELLVELRNTEATMALMEVQEERTATREQLNAVERTLLSDSKSLAPADRVRLAGRRSELEVRLAHLDNQVRHLDDARRRLKVVSPVSGEVLTWNVERLLTERPVGRGDVLLSIATMSQEWELEVYIPEAYVGHVLRAQRSANEPLLVTIRSTADPSAEFTGRLMEIQGAAEVREDRGNTVAATVAVCASECPSLKPGMEAVVKIHCGTRSLAHVWFHDVVDFFWSRIWFRLN